MKTETVVQLDPAKVLAQGNHARFGLLSHRVDAMAQSIVDRGGIITPVEVVKLGKPVNGHTHQLRVGFYRHAAALKLNTEQGAGLTLPAVERDALDDKETMLRQVSENQDRENLSPMDRAVAMKGLLDGGVDKGEVRKLFAVPGGRKGTVMQPASNSYVNIHLSLLGLSKAIQAKIHDGRIPISAAMKLVDMPADQRDAILEKAEADRQKALDRDERADKVLAREAAGGSRELAKVERRDAAKVKLDEAAAAMQAATEGYDAAKAGVKEAQKVGPEEERLGRAFSEWTDKEKKAFAEKLGGAKVALREAEKALGKAKRTHSSAEQAHKKLAAPAEAAAPKATAKGKTKGTVSAKGIAKAAKEAGVAGAKHVPLSAADARDAAATLAKSRFPKVKAIGMILGKVLSGEIVPATAETDLSVLTGERKTKLA